MAKLNQIIAIEKGTKSRVYSADTERDKILQKPALFNGMTRNYKSNDDQGDQLPPEKVKVQHKVKDILDQVERHNTEYFDLTARKDWTNCTAKADVVIDGAVIIPQAPVSFLLFLEKQLTDLKTMIGRLPVTDVAEDWELDENSGLFKTAETKAHRTKKVQKPIVLIAPTVEHPGQAQLVTEDIIEGYWYATKQSGAMRQPDQDTILERIVKLLQAVKQAREAANMQEEVDTPKIGEPVFTYLFGE